MAETVNVLVKVADQSGAAVAGGRVTATLNTAEVDDTSGYILPEEASATIDANGEATLVLWPNELGSTQSQYDIKILNPDTGKTLSLTATIPNHDCELHVVANLPAYPGKTDGQLAFDTVVAAAAAVVTDKADAEAARDAAIAARVLAEGAATTATSAAGTATTSATTAGAAATTATAAATSATASATAASTSATTAGAASTAAGTSATAASASATAASGSATTAGTAATAAAASETAAGTSATGAAGSATTAGTAATAAGTSATAAGTSATAASGSATAAAASATAAAASAAAALHGYMLVREEQAPGTSGGAAAGGSENERVLNTTVSNSIPGASLASNAVTLPAGRFQLRGAAPAITGSSAHQAKIASISGDSVLMYGSLAGKVGGPVTGTVAYSEVIGEITLTQATALKLYSRTSSGINLGTANSLYVEIYSFIEIRQVA